MATTKYIDDTGPMAIRSGTTFTIESGGYIDFAATGGLKVAATAVNATAAELNALVGSALTTTSTAKLQAITATSTEINSLVGSGLTTTSTAKLQALTPTSTALNLMLQGTTAAFKLARGTAQFTTSSEITTGLATVVAGNATLQSDPDVTAQWVSVAASTTAGNILAKLWQPTATNNYTPIAATKTNVIINWQAVGT